jgi:hypothetical protein
MRAIVAPDFKVGTGNAVSNQVADLVFGHHGADV